MDNLNILIVEDESLVALELKHTIIDFGYNVVGFATNNETAKKLMLNSNINLILMDINLNDTLNGIELYKELNTTISIVYLTAYKDDDTISQAIQTNPIGYLVKPYSDDELKALLKLCFFKIKNKKIVRIDSKHMVNLSSGYSFDIKEEKLFCDDIFIKLSPKELQLLRLLIEANGSFVSYYIIENEIWPDTIMHDTAIRSLIYRLRCKLGHKLITNEFDYGIKLEM